ncbi:N-acetylglutaminylglutamine amidotransferase [Pseudochrobactrum kiredjianiae]|uniref:asparagine synthase (glutamine-hydrolyzing) n=1 Tax=Pseudochrobactrum kiredjianiae TaxID=386305 RepID=A0ABW3UYU2_9HYPH|nr:N-acetylglutaminylglutamine amidotransferase [Pseudochrobactrum kiredjianiae]MDM7852496.1 N-acetylglutaminylglutamine amidotransferase [Pseudochrobactrum kiredjianiae]
MCGICGEINFKGEPSIVNVEKMMRNLQSRGPDAAGLLKQGNVAFGHRRLSIIDTSNVSQQPMFDPELGLAIVFNGCIYNYVELRAELKSKGYRFFSTGDTEVILKAYHAWGVDCLNKLIGMFAFAIWERDRGRTILVRDRLGIKPLYYNENTKYFRFASTLPALLECGDVDTSIDSVALHYYMSFHAAVPAPFTILKGIRKLPPATYIVIDRTGKREEHRYWSLNIGIRSADEQYSKQDWQEMVFDAVELAVMRRQIADVPTGVLLSGGLDSSLIVALLVRNGQSDLKTFSVGFDDVNGITGNEYKYSDLIAEQYGTEHTRIHVSPEETLSALPAAVGTMSEPMMSHDSVGFYLLSQQVTKNAKVVQSGQGADEVFGGYHWYPKLENSQNPLDDYAKLYFDRDHAEMQKTLSPDYIGDDHSRIFVEEYFEKLSASSPINKALQIDTDIMLVDDPVKRVDNMTMAFGVEARVPFLDHELVELAARIPSQLKVGHGGKYILKEAARKILPAEVIDRPKGYFPVPALKYIQGGYLTFIKMILNQPAARSRGLFNAAYIDGLLAAPDAALTPKGHSKLWQIGSLELWLQSHGI